MEPSPAESFLPAPGEVLPSLFGTAQSPTLNPMEMMTPSSAPEDGPTPSQLSVVPEDTPTPNSAEKKPAKKRKSWGQVLPEPKTNLPPRKRAKTEDEKEQRRVERVLRNRRAAQSSRERKRQEVEALEQRNKLLEHKLEQIQKTNEALLEELKRHRRESGLAVPAMTGSPLEHTLSSSLFSGPTLDANNSLDNLVAPTTVNPASLSPKPIEQELETSQKAEAAPSDDMAQHSAAMLCDLQCQSSVEPCLPLHPSSTNWEWMVLLGTQLAITVISACQRPLTQIAMSLKAGFSIAPTPHILTTIIWLVTQPRSSQPRRSTSTNGSTTTTISSHRTSAQRTSTPLPTYLASSRKASTLRVKLLKKILACSPILARPLSDATFAALRLVSRGHDDRVESCRIEPSQSQEVDSALTQCLKQIDLPSREVLLTLLWVLKLEQRRMDNEKGITGSTRPESVPKAPSQQFSSSALSGKVDRTPGRAHDVLARF